MKNSFSCVLKWDFFTALLFVICIISFNGCTCNREKTGSETSNEATEKQSVQMTIKRFEKDLFSLNLDSVQEGAEQLKADYGEFFYMFNRILKIGQDNDPGYAERLKGFITDYYQNINYKKVFEIYPDVQDLEAEFQKAFTNYKGNFPDRHIPQIFSYVSGWNNMVVCSDTILAIGLDMFLGSNCDFYVNLQFPKYLRYSMQKGFIVPLSMQEWAITQFEFKDSATNLLSSMLYQGKVMYFVKKMLPEAHDTLIFGYRPDQIKWCMKNEKQMWAYLLEKKLLFSTDYTTINKLIGPAPFTVYFSPESPGKATVWLGYKIIDAYMRENSGLTLAQLMKETDYQKILRKSRYKP